MSVLFIADLHLEVERPDITRAFLHFLQTRASRAEALYILGDFFEVWVGDDAMDEFQRAIAQALRQLADRGTRIFLMHGNRDFMLGQGFCREAGCTLLREGSVIELNGEPVLLLHGDSLCTRDESYQRLRKRLRNPFSLWLLRNLPLSTRHKLARKLRDASRMRTREKAAEIIDVTPEVVPQVMAERGVRTLIHGHTHRPAVHKLLVDGQSAQRIVLGDWDRQGWALEVDAQGYHLAPFPLG
ncbi:UDP-2,3-diacylglucosamine hydrolase [Geopseudomonas sagittaria]|uniref:UDP-2,3-diacylglucosamine hydrolase n=1 Tax=Geopseudomonas sagittaria TaxID=1135990 RepID=A0A1I5R7J2_9GAMM|nr:UDP-2,3-diacylglucosamine diphosphatase [Pseudomonas sagittaria]MCM2330334.1 UDP-2,3-diacylglucosamine diphosphatase [Pseudomonas sagittaria]SFP54492.1 UDP-2,3-diacylglucosamine hydrolase [Pseudomonas sagittaria]